METDQEPVNAQERLGAFVRAMWPTLAAMAWRNSMRLGSGALLVPWSAVQAWETAVTPFPLQVQYMTPVAADEAARDGMFEVETLMLTYDPERSVVVVCTTDEDAARRIGCLPMRAGSYVWCNVFTEEPSPPAAHAAQGS